MSALIVEITSVAKLMQIANKTVTTLLNLDYFGANYILHQNYRKVCIVYCSIVYIIAVSRYLSALAAQRRLRASMRPPRRTWRRYWPATVRRATQHLYIIMGRPDTHHARNRFLTTAITTECDRNITTKKHTHNYTPIEFVFSQYSVPVLRDYDRREESRARSVPTRGAPRVGEGTAR